MMSSYGSLKLVACQAIVVRYDGTHFVADTINSKLVSIDDNALQTITFKLPDDQWANALAAK